MVSGRSFPELWGGWIVRRCRCRFRFRFRCRRRRSATAGGTVSVPAPIDPQTHSVETLPEKRRFTFVPARVPVCACEQRNTGGRRKVRKCVRRRGKHMYSILRWEIFFVFFSRCRCRCRFLNAMPRGPRRGRRRDEAGLLYILIANHATCHPSVNSIMTSECLLKAHARAHRCRRAAKRRDKSHRITNNKQQFITSNIITWFKAENISPPRPRHFFPNMETPTIRVRVNVRSSKIITGRTVLGTRNVTKVDGDDDGRKIHRRYARLFPFFLSHPCNLFIRMLTTN